MTRMTEPWREWRHVVKLDPDRDVTDELLQAVGESGTDAVLLGGTQGITYEKVSSLFGRLRRHAPDVPVWQEISGVDTVIDGVAGYAVPVVLNSGSPEWMIGAHAQAIARYRPLIDWSRVLPEGYLVLNEEAAVARLTEARTSLSYEEAGSYALAGESLFSMPVIYIEYSGRYGDVEMVAEVCRMLQKAHIFYGGGIDSYEKAAEMGRYADTVIVGNALYGANGIEILEETIRAVK